MKKIDYILMGKNIKRLRNEYGFKQVDIAKRMNVSPSLVSYWEKGVRNPDYNTLLHLAEIFDVEVEQITGVKPLNGVTDQRAYQAIEVVDYKLKQKQTNFWIRLILMLTICVYSFMPVSYESIVIILAIYGIGYIISDLYYLVLLKEKTKLYNVKLNHDVYFELENSKETELDRSRYRILLLLLSTTVSIFILTGLVYAYEQEMYVLLVLPYF